MVRSSVGILAACLLTVSSASADIMFSLVPTGSTTVVAGTSVTIQLVATDPDNLQILNGDTWFGFNARVLADTADANDAPLQTVGPKFNAPPVPPAGATDAFNAGVGRSFAGVGTLANLANNDVLASFTYVADVVGDTTFSFNTGSPGFNVASLNTGDVDTAGGLSALGTTTITVTAVPEPSSVALLGLVGVGLCVARFRRRKTV